MGKQWPDNKVQAKREWRERKKERVEKDIKARHASVMRPCTKIG